jgi:hypothetical protein
LNAVSFASAPPEVKKTEAIDGAKVINFSASIMDGMVAEPE